MRVLVACFLVAFSGAMLNPTFAADLLQEDGKAAAMPYADFKADGGNVFCYSSLRKSTIMLEAITLGDGDRSIKITAKDDVLEIALGAALIQTAGIRLHGRPGKMEFHGAPILMNPGLVDLAHPSDPKK